MRADPNYVVCRMSDQDQNETAKLAYRMFHLLTKEGLMNEHTSMALLVLALTIWMRAGVPKEQAESTIKTLLHGLERAN